MEDDMNVKAHLDLARSNEKFPVEMEMMKKTIESNRETIKLAKQTVKYMRISFILSVIITITAILGIALTTIALLIKMQEIP